MSMDIIDIIEASRGMTEHPIIPSIIDTDNWRDEDIFPYEEDEEPDIFAEYLIKRG